VALAGALLLAGTGGCARFFRRPAPAGPTPATVPGQLPPVSPEGQDLPGAAGPGDPRPDPRGAPIRRGELAEADKPEWMRPLVVPDIPLRWYPRVNHFLELYRSDPRYRDIIRGWLKRLPAHRGGMEAILVKHGLPAGLVFVAMIESGFTSSALSSRGAGGFWQFKSDVARGYGLEVSFWIDERRDPEKSTAAAALYFEDLYKRFGTWELALAGYNAGFYAVTTSITRYNTNDFYTLSQLEAGLPWETTEYVPKVMAVAIVERNRQAFGFGDLAVEVPAPALEPATIPPGVSFSTIATRLGIGEDDLVLMNPAYLRRRTPPDRGPVTLRVPRGSSGRLTGLRGTDTVSYRVKPGETVARIARRERIARDRLRRLNGLSDDDEVVPGTVILLPRAAAKPAKRR
jgi:membrane-bound lytic murein transglycosylase D